MRVLALWLILLSPYCTAQFPRLDTYRSGKLLTASLGRGLARTGDVDGDGIEDFAASYRSPQTSIGHVVYFSGADGTALRYLAHGDIQDGYGTSIVNLGDIEGDGHPDLAVGMPGFEGFAIGSQARGRVLIYSGFDGRIIQEILGDQIADGFGSAVANVGDLDGDGRADLAVGAFAFATSVPLIPSIRLVSSHLGQEILTITAPKVEQGFGEAMAGIGDYNGDGLGDVLIGISGAGTAGIHSGRVELRSGSDGTIFWSRAGTGAEQRFGQALLATDDRNGDGYNDFWASSPEGLIGVTGGSVGLYSGLDGSLIVTIPTPPSGYFFGATLAFVGDQDGDGRDDLMIGAPGSFVDPGGVYVYSSSSYLMLSQRNGSVAGRLGRAISGTGDLDGDGLDDFLVAAPIEQASQDSSGRVFALSNLAVPPLVSVSGDEDPGLFGNAVASVGDVDGDGVTDTLVATTQTPGSQQLGNVKIFSGATGQIIHDIPHDSGPGGHLPGTGLGDVNGDGHADFAVGNARLNSQTGEVVVYSGLDAQVLYTLVGDGTGDLFGACLASIGDLDHDGIAELAVGAPACAIPSCLGYVRIFSGIDGQVLRTHFGQTPDEQFGKVVADLGDADGDGVGDYVVGAPAFAPFVIGFGSIRIFSGAAGSLIWEATGIEQGDGVGLALAGGEDIDGDGRDDLLVGASAHQGFSGRWWALSGANGSLIHSRGGGASERLGMPVALLPDMNGDGLAEIVAASTGNPNRGFVTIYSGADASPIEVFERPEAQDNFGEAMDVIPDLNGDGFPELVIAGTNGGDFGYVQVMMVCGAQKFRVSGAPNQSLNLSYEANDPSDPSLGRIRITGGGPGNLMGACTSAGRFYMPFASTGLFLDVSLGTQDTFVHLDGQGEASFPFNLANPSLAGQTRYIQVMEFEASAPGGLLGSNGLAVRFCP